MKTKIHYEIGRLINGEMSDNGMALNKFLFVTGNLAPDLIVSYLFRQHSYTLCSVRLYKIIRWLYDSGVTPGCFRFSFFLGVASHYLCDFFCYPHTKGYNGSVSEHVLYENCQILDVDDMLPFNTQSSLNYSYSALTSALDEHMAEYEKILSRNNCVSSIDIQLAVYITRWAVSAIYLNAAIKPFAGEQGTEIEAALPLSVM